MKLELKKVKYAEHASQETSNFVAELYVDGKPFAIVGNDGIGGCDYHYRHEKYPSDHSDWHKELENLFKWHEENTTYETEYDPRGYSEGSLDITVGELLDDYLTTKRVKNLMSRSMIVFKKDDPKGGYYKYGKKKYNITRDRMGWFNNQMWQQFKDNWVCLNHMPLNEAVAYYKAN